MPEKEAQAAAFCGEAVIAEFESLTRDAAAVQRDTLRRILADNACAEYLRCRGLAGRTDAASFRACVPLATHADIEPYIARIADGDTSPVLTAKPITSISLRSVITVRNRARALDSTRSVYVGEPPCVTDDGRTLPPSAGPIIPVSCSSGTTQGKRKYLPFNQELVKSTMQIYRTSYAFRNR